MIGGPLIILIVLIILYPFWYDAQVKKGRWKK
jgi:hypothetical protein